MELTSPALRLLLVLLIWWTLSIGQRCRSAQSEETYFHALLQRELYRVAEEYAARRLAEPTLPPDDRARLAIHLSAALAQHATLAPGADAEELWKEAERVVAALMNSDPSNPQRLALRTRLAILPAEHGQQLSREVNVAPENAELHTQATNQLRVAIDGIVLLLKQFEAESSSRSLSPQERADGELLDRDRVELADQLQFQLAQSRVELARLLSAGPERAGLLLDAAAGVEKLNRRSLDEELAGEAKLLRASIARIERDESRAESLLKTLIEPTNLPLIRDRAIAEMVRLQLDLGAADQGLGLISARVKESTAVHPELRAMLVAAFLELFRVAKEQGDEKSADDFLLAAKQQLPLISGYWNRLANALVHRAAQTQELGPELASLMQSAQTAYAAGQVDVALKLYADSALQARELGHPDRAEEFAVTRASILLNRQQFQEAETALAEVILIFSQSAKIADYDLLRCYALGKLTEKSTSKEVVNRYRTALQHHLQLYSGTTAEEARWMLGVLEEQQEQFSAAWEVYSEIPPMGGHGEEALLRMAIIADQLRTREVQDAIDLTAAAQLLMERAESFPLPPTRLSLMQAEVTVFTSKLLLRDSSPAYLAADALLERVQASVDAEQRDAESRSEPLPPAWQALQPKMWRLRTVSLAGQGRINDARAMLIRLDNTNPLALLSVLHGLNEISSFVNEFQRTELAALQLQASRSIEMKRDSLSADDRQRLDEVKGSAYAATGKFEEAAEIYERLLADNPQDGRLMQLAAAVYQRRGLPEDLERAWNWWGKLESTHTKGTAAWFDVRLKLAEVLVSQHKCDELKKLIGVTRIVYPELGGADRRRQFESLLSRCKS